MSEGDRRSLGERLAHLSPTQREQGAALVVLCELVDELVQATHQQTVALRAMAVAVRRDGLSATPHPGQQEQGGGQVQLREPGVPPPDPDTEPTPPADPAEPPAADPPPVRPARRAKRPATPK